jgi:hypothetical protein
MAEIEKNDFNLNISRYISTATAEEEIDLAATHGELVEIEGEIQVAMTKHNEFLNQLGLVHPREVFRLAIIAAASAVIVMHNHPSGESSPSEADIKVTRDLIRAGQLLKMELIDHVVIGNGNFSSLRALGYFYA